MQISGAALHPKPLAFLPPKDQLHLHHCDHHHHHHHHSHQEQHKEEIFFISTLGGWEDKLREEALGGISAATIFYILAFVCSKPQNT